MQEPLQRHGAPVGGTCLEPEAGLPRPDGWRPGIARIAPLELVPLLGDLATEEVVESSPAGGHGRQLPDLLERGSDGRAQDVTGELELQPQFQEATQAQAHGDERFGASTAHPRR